MAFTFGFYNSLDGDRKYDAEQISALFDGLIRDGVFSSIDEILGTVPGTGLQVIVKPGKAWFNRTWNYNDAPMPLDLAPADLTLPRMDCVVLEVDSSTGTRKNRIRVIEGTPATTPKRPALAKTMTLNQHPLADVTVPANATQINSGNISVKVGTADCPFVTGILATANIDVLFQEWNYDFNVWFDNVKAQLEGNIVTNLQKQIDERLKIVDKTSVNEVVEGVSTSKYATPAIIHTFLPGFAICSSTAGAANKVAAFTSKTAWALFPGALLTVFFQNGISTTNTTLTVGGIGPVPIALLGTVPLKSNVSLVYDGSRYVVIAVDTVLSGTSTLLYSKFTSGSFNYSVPAGVNKLGIVLGASGTMAAGTYLSYGMFGNSSVYTFEMKPNTSASDGGYGGKVVQWTISPASGTYSGSIAAAKTATSINHVEDDSRIFGPRYGGENISFGYYTSSTVDGSPNSSSFAGQTASGVGTGVTNIFDPGDSQLYGARGGKASFTATMTTTGSGTTINITNRINSPEIFGVTYPRGTRADGVIDSTNGITPTGPANGGGACVTLTTSRSGSFKPGGGAPGFILIYDLTGK